MDASTCVNQMLSGNNIFVPTYQRAYSWEEKQTAQFMADLQDYVKSRAASRYYFGHFLFEDKGNHAYAIIDGQQRLTTITIFIAVIYDRLRERAGELSEEDKFAYGTLVKVGQSYRFATVDYDNQLFKDYVINKVKRDHGGLDTESQKRIVAAHDYFAEQLNGRDEETLRALLDAVANATCTTHTVKDEAEAIQMFIFQNNRGKKPSSLEIVKAQFLYNIHLRCATEDEREELVSEVKNRFENIYKSISKIEGNIDEDDVLAYTLRVHFNNLDASNALRKVEEELGKEQESIAFVRDFTRSLANSFEQIVVFFQRERTDMTLHTLWTVGQPSIVFPFVIKAYGLGVPADSFNALAKSLASIFLRHRVIGTRAVLSWRLNGMFQDFTGDVRPVTSKIEWMKTTSDGWWNYWNDNEFRRVLEGNFDGGHGIAKIILWLYENHLIESGKAGYSLKRYDSVEKSQCEHIAPQTENGSRQSGYCHYDDDFRDNYLNCLGNYLLLSGHHNESIGNIPFEEKRATYTQLLQQQEVRDMTVQDHLWDKGKISMRKERIVSFVTETF